MGRNQTGIDVGHPKLSLSTKFERNQVGVVRVTAPSVFTSTLEGWTNGQIAKLTFMALYGFSDFEMAVFGFHAACDSHGKRSWPKGQ